MMAPVKPAMLSQLRWLAFGVEELRARLPKEFDLRFPSPVETNGDELFDFGSGDGVLDPPMFMGLLPELLAEAATASPNLKQLSLLDLSYSTGAVLESCACLTQITKLTLTEMELGKDTSVAQIQCLSKLQALEVRCLKFPLRPQRKVSREKTSRKAPICDIPPQRSKYILWKLGPTCLSIMSAVRPTCF